MLVVSQPWQRLDDFIRVFVSFVHATKDEMGFDPTVRRVMFHNRMCYVYQVDGRFFRTINPLFRGRVLGIAGRMTRVWEAVEVGGTSEEEIRKEKNGGRRCVVKDVWLDKDSHTEGNNLSKIFAALDNLDVETPTSTRPTARDSRVLLLISSMAGNTINISWPLSATSEESLQKNALKKLIPIPRYSIQS